MQQVQECTHWKTFPTSRTLLSSKKDLIVTDTVYAPRETVMMKQAKEAGCEKVFNGMGMMLFQALIAIKLYTGKDTPVDYMKEKLGI